MDSDDGKEKGGVTAVRKGEAMKSLEKATADYEKAKEKMEASKARYEADLKRFKAAEIAKTENLQEEPIFQRRTEKCVHSEYRPLRINCFKRLSE